jgi:hypothetical protein
MPAAVRHRRAGFPTAALSLIVALALGLAAPADAALPPPWRLAIVFDREVWAAPVAPSLRSVPIRPGMYPVTFEERAHG